MSIPTPRTRAARLTGQIADLLPELVRWRRGSKRSKPCVGSRLIVAVTVVAEVGEFSSLSTSPGQLMAYLGLTPSEAFQRHKRARVADHKGRERYWRGRALIEGASSYRCRMCPAEAARQD